MITEHPVLAAMDEQNTSPPARDGNSSLPSAVVPVIAIAAFVFLVCGVAAMCHMARSCSQGRPAKRLPPAALNITADLEALPSGSLTDVPDSAIPANRRHASPSASSHILSPPSSSNTQKLSMLPTPLSGTQSTRYHLAGGLSAPLQEDLPAPSPALERREATMDNRVGGQSHSASSPHADKSEPSQSAQSIQADKSETSQSAQTIQAKSRESAESPQKQSSMQSMEIRDGQADHMDAALADCSTKLPEGPPPQASMDLLGTQSENAMSAVPTFVPLDMLGSGTVAQGKA